MLHGTFEHHALIATYGDIADCFAKLSDCTQSLFEFDLRQCAQFNLAIRHVFMLGCFLQASMLCMPSDRAPCQQVPKQCKATCA